MIYNFRLQIYEKFLISRLILGKKRHSRVLISLFFVPLQTE